MKAALDLCVSCKACRRECPTGVDMARMKIEALSHYYARHGLPLRERLVAWLPRYAPYAAHLAPLLNLRDRIPALARLSEKMLGFSAERSLPRWQKPYREPRAWAAPGDVVGDGRDIILFADTFNRYFEPDNLSAARRVLDACGYRVHAVSPVDGGRPLCCGRTFLASGQVAHARTEARRTLATLAPYVAKGARIVGLEPSCLMTFRDEHAALLPGDVPAGMANATLMIEEALAADLASGVIAPKFRDQSGRVAHLHGHCHQKAFEAMAPVERVLAAIPGLTVKPIESSCCGMAGSFGYNAGTIATSKAMAEFSLLPALRKADAHDLVVADGTSCRHQIADGVGREAVHVVRVLDDAL